MGCFNANGFFSRLPLQSGDDMVLIFCADLTRVGHRDGLPIEVADAYFPLNAPIYCKYNDYGAVFEDTVVKNANAEYFEKSIGATCEELCEMIHEYGNMGIAELEEVKAKTLEEDGDTDYTKKRIDRDNRYLNILHLFFDNAYDRWKDKMGLIWIMEHKDVYERVAKIGEGAIIDDWHDDTDIVQKRCDKAFELAKDFPQFDDQFNLLDLSKIKDSIRDLYLSEACSAIGNADKVDFGAKIKELRDKYGREYETMFTSSCLIETGYCEEFFATYSKLNGAKEWEKLKDDFVNFFRFTRVMASLHMTLQPSTYASQSVYTKPLSRVIDIISDKAKEICKEYNEMYGNED